MSETDAFENSIALLQRAKDGDARALHDVLERYQGRLLDRIRIMLGAEARRSAQSIDFLQGVFLEALEGFERFEIRDERSLIRWLTTIARNNIRNAARKSRSRRLESLAGEAFPDAVEAGEAPGPATEADQSEKLHRLAEALEELDEEHREVIRLRDIDGRRFREIAEQLGISRNGARLLYNRAIVELGRRVGRQVDGS